MGIKILNFCEVILLLYFCVAGVIFLSQLFMEYFRQKQNELIRFHHKPNILSLIKTIPEHLRISLLWPNYITRYF